MKYVFSYVSIALLTLVSFNAAAADNGSYRNDFEVLFVLLLLLLMLWLLLPLAVFGLNRKINLVIKEIRETNDVLTEIKDVLAAISEEETTATCTEQTGKSTDEDIVDLYNQIKFDP
ncbi:MAG: hypothetical protein WBO73_16075 [Gammaproteobacteria bacterium]